MKSKTIIILLLIVATIVSIGFVVYLLKVPKRYKAAGETVNLSFDQTTINLDQQPEFSVNINAKPSVNINTRGYAFKVNFDQSGLEVTKIEYKLGRVSQDLGDDDSILASVNNQGIIKIQGEIIAPEGQLLSSTNNTDIVTISFKTKGEQASAIFIDPNNASFYIFNSDYIINEINANPLNSTAVTTGSEEQVVGRVMKRMADGHEEAQTQTGLTITSADAKTAEWGENIQPDLTPPAMRPYYKIGRWLDGTQVTITLNPGADYSCWWDFEFTPENLTDAKQTDVGCSARIVIHKGSYSPDWQNHLTYHIREITNTQIPQNTQTPEATEAPASITPLPTATPVPHNVTVNFKLKFQGIIGEPFDNSPINVKIQLANEKDSYQDISRIQTLAFTYDTADIWKAKTTFKKVVYGNDFKFYFKGPKHLQKKICVIVPQESEEGKYQCDKGKININQEEITLDASNIYLLAGDLPNQNGIIDAYDIALTINNFGKIDAPSLLLADINKDKIVDTQDYSLIIQTLGMGMKYDDE